MEQKKSTLEERMNDGFENKNSSMTFKEALEKGDWVEVENANQKTDNEYGKRRNEFKSR